MLKRIRKENKAYRQDRFSYQRALLKNRSWILILICSLLGVYFILGLPLYLVYFRDTVMTSLSFPSQKAARSFAGQMLFQDFYVGIPLMILVTVLAVVNGIQIFSYQFSLRTIDFYGGLPVKKSNRFLQRYLNGFLVFLIPFFVTGFLGALIAAGMQGMTTQTFQEAIYGMIRMILYYLGIYSMAVLAAQLSGRGGYAALMAILLISGEAIANVLLAFLRATYFYTYYQRSHSLFDQYHLFLSPTYSILLGRKRMLETFSEAETVRSGFDLVRADLSSVSWILVLAALFTGLSYLAFSLRKPESAGKSITFRPVRILTKIYFCVFGSVFLGTLFDQILWKAGQALRIVLVLLVICIAGMMIGALFDLITGERERREKKRLSWTVTSLALAVFVLLIFRQDFLGYDRYLPKTSSVESAALYLLNPEDVRRSSDGSDTSMMTITDVDAVKKAAEIGQDYQRRTSIENGGNTRFLGQTEGAASSRGTSRTKTPSGSAGARTLSGGVLTGSVGNTLQARSTVTSADGFQALVVYHMRSGRQIYRRILLPYSVKASVLDPILSSDAYQEAVFRLSDASALPSESGFGLTYDAGYTSRSVGDLDGAMEEFLQAYSSDLAQYSYSFVKKNDPIGTVRWTTDSSQFSYEVYPSYTNTIAFLEKHEVYLPPVPSGKQVRSLELEEQTASDDSETSHPEMLSVKKTKNLGKLSDSSSVAGLLREMARDPENFGVYNDAVTADWKDRSSTVSGEWIADGGKKLRYHLTGQLETDDEGQKSLSLSFHGKPSEEVLRLFSVE